MVAAVTVAIVMVSESCGGGGGWARVARTAALVLALSDTSAEVGAVLNIGSKVGDRERAVRLQPELSSGWDWVRAPYVLRAPELASSSRSSARSLRVAPSLSRISVSGVIAALAGTSASGATTRPVSCAMRVRRRTWRAGMRSSAGSVAKRDVSSSMAMRRST